VSRQKRRFTPAFKKYVVQLYEKGKSRADIIRQYDVSASTLDRWIKQSQTPNSFSNEMEYTSGESNLMTLRKENLQFEVNINIKLSVDKRKQIL
jgi:transposase